MFGALTELLLGAGSTFVLMALIFWPLERAFPARPEQQMFRRRWRLDLCFFVGQHLLFGWLSFRALGVLAHLWRNTGVPLPEYFVHLPLGVKLALALVLGDLLSYWGHRLQHRVPWLWRWHAVHHSCRELDWLAAHREHPLDGLYTMTLLNLPAILLGVPFSAAMGVVVFRGLWAVMIHANVRLPLGPLAYLFGAPELHHWHHARHARPCNFGNLAPWTDWVFGTHYRPGRLPNELGVVEAMPESYLGLLFRWGAPDAAPDPSSSSSPSPGPPPSCQPCGARSNSSLTA